MGFNTSLGLGGGYSILPTLTPTVSDQNYIDFTSSATAGWAQQYLPELYEQEVERYGNRTISGFLQMVGAEMPMESDQVVWSEQNRLHIAYKGGSGNSTCVLATATGVVTLGSDYQNAVRVGNTVVITDAATGLNTLKCYVSASSGQEFTVKTYSQAALTTVVSNGGAINVFVYGSEFAKGSASMVGELKPQFTQYSNKPIIIKDHFKIDGSDTAQIGWVETTDEAGQTGYSWYLKAAGETRLRFEDYLETSLVEAEKAVSGTSNTAIIDTDGTTIAGVTGTEGYFAAVSARGNVFENIGAMSDFDLILKNLDKQGSVEENMLYLNRDTALVFDDMLAGLDGGNTGAGSAYGVFNNDADMALNLGFSAFRRGSYDFYKSDWKYLNDAAARGGFGDIEGTLIPAGTSTVYDQSLGKNIKRPFLHVRYRASQTDDRRMKSWVTGSVGSASYTGDDVMEVHYLSERCLVVQGANNFMLLKKA